MKWVNRKCKDFLIGQGYENIYMFPHSRFSQDFCVSVNNEKNQSVFAKFDGFALKKGEICLFQFKSNNKPPLQPYMKFSEQYHLPCKVLVYYDREGVKEFSFQATDSK